MEERQSADRDYHCQRPVDVRFRMIRSFPRRAFGYIRTEICNLYQHLLKAIEELYLMMIPRSFQFCPVVCKRLHLQHFLQLGRVPAGRKQHDGVPTGKPNDMSCSHFLIQL